jgi:hypothetical protein
VANKVRTPAPPRRVQAPQQRRDPTPPEQRAKMFLYIFAGLGIVGLLAVLALFVLGGNGGGSAADQIEAAGGTLQEIEALDSANHVTAPPPRDDYNTWPPTSGPHHPEWAPYQVFDEPVEQYRLVHNLEHGGIVIQYGSDVPQSTVDEVVEWWRNDPNGIVVAPFPELGDEIALAAWTAPEGGEGGTSYLARLPRFDEDAFDAFVDAYGFRGPERFPRELLTPDS